ncbi:MAG TPA: peptidylprolyl isomerase, partial [Ilumatobacteraceae bacterium]|nr:peptidylprolyl isomerase [Ilumatobacteraceae bacterium]
MRATQRIRRIAGFAGLACAGALLFASPCAAYTPPETDPRIVVNTTVGPILIALAPENAPDHVKQFLRAIASGDFSSASVTDIAPNYSVQLVGALGSAPLAGGPVEHAKVGNVRGAFSVYDGGQPGDAPSLMFVIVSSPELDQDYTPIGFVEVGMDVVRAIANSGTIGSDQHPAETISITDVHMATNKERVVLRAAEISAETDHGTALLAAVFILASASFVAAVISAFHDRLGRRRVTSLSMLAALLTFFAIWVALGGTRAGSGLTGVVLFGGAIATFRLMGRFERPAPTPASSDVAQPRELADGELHSESGIDQTQGELEV